ncbi:hypothetical protein BH24ACT9_BH24ACT9_15780 [soil metagenome]
MTGAVHRYRKLPATPARALVRHLTQRWDGGSVVVR